MFICNFIISAFLPFFLFLSLSPSLQARVIFDKATKVQFKSVDDLANVWCEYAEMELRHEYI